MMKYFLYKNIICQLLFPQVNDFVSLIYSYKHLVYWLKAGKTQVTENLESSGEFSGSDIFSQLSFEGKYT